MELNEQLREELIDLKVWYFASKYYSLNNWITFNQVQLPNNISLSQIKHWEAEKQQYLAQEKVNLEGISQEYQQRIRDRLDEATAIKEKIRELYAAAQTTKEVNEMARTLEKIASLEDEAMKLLKVNSYEAKIYEKNKVSTTNLLREKMEIV